MPDLVSKIFKCNVIKKGSGCMGGAGCNNKKDSKLGHLNKSQIFVTYPTDQKYKKANMNINFQLPPQKNS